MKTFLKQLWTEPAVFGHAINAGLQIAQVLTIHDTTVNAILVAAGGVLFGATTRSVVQPTRRPNAQRGSSR